MTADPPATVLEKEPVRSAPASPPPTAAGDAPLRVLMTAPDLERVGGVSNYVAICRPYFSDAVELATRGARGGERGRAAALRRGVGDGVRLGRRILRGGHDVVHQNTSFVARGLLRDALVPVYARAAGKPIVIFFHGWDQAFAARLGGGWRALLRRVYFRADAIVVLASEFRDQLRAWGYTGPVHVETTVVDDGLVAPARNPSPERPVEVLFMARLEREKGVMTAIQAVERLAAGRRVRLTVAGDGAARAEAEAYVRERGLESVVRFPGFVVGDARLELLRGADVYLFPTWHGEGMPTTVLEAMSCGLPVVTRPVGGLRDFFEDGRMGCLTESREPEEFARLLDGLVADPARRADIGAANAAYARERFAASRVVARLQGIYRQAIAHAQSR